MKRARLGRMLGLTFAMIAGGILGSSDALHDHIVLAWVISFPLVIIANAVIDWGYGR